MVNDPGKRLKILIGAYACNPRGGSEAGVGWGWIKELSRFHDLHVITAEFNKKDIEPTLYDKSIWADPPRFHYVPHKMWHYSPTYIWKRIENSALKPIMNLAYSCWLMDSKTMACQLHEQYKFDLAHQLTYVGFRFPGYLWQLPIPFVWGPIGGLENTPWRFLPLMGTYGAIFYGFRNVINTLHKKMLPNVHKAFQKGTGGIIAATEGIRNEIKVHYGKESIVICEIGPPPKYRNEITCRSMDEPLRLCWSARHLPGKALPLLLDALKQVGNKQNWCLDVIGGGPFTEGWKALAESNGIAERCHWHGWLARDEALAIMQQAHVFVITSLKDLTSTVLLEALAQGLPVIALDHCGFSNVLTPECGIKILLETPRQVSADIANAVQVLFNDEDQRRALAHGALCRIKDFSWESKMEVLNHVYHQALKRSVATQ